MVKWLSNLECPPSQSVRFNIFPIGMPINFSALVSLLKKINLRMYLRVHSKYYYINDKENTGK